MAVKRVPFRTTYRGGGRGTPVALVTFVVLGTLVAFGAVVVTLAPEHKAMAPTHARSKVAGNLTVMSMELQVPLMQVYGVNWF